MANIHIQHAHQLGLKKARKVALDWAESAEKKLAMECTYEEGDAYDCVHFKRQGAAGTMFVRNNEFEIDVKLGMFLSAFKVRIEDEIKQTLLSRL
jgi:putative polyhydroxyalkanoate system protein